MKGHAISYSDAEMAWLAENRTMVVSEYHAAFVATFDRPDVALKNLHALRKRKGWKTGRTGQFVKGQVSHNKGKKCAPGTGGLHPNARRTQFKKGRLPHNTNYLGHERVSKDGYIEISIDERNPYTGFERRYVLKHRHVWEKANGPLPKGMCLKCLDGNKQNTDPANWEAVPRSILPRLNGGPKKRRLAYDDAAPEVRPAILAAAKLDHLSRVKTRRRAG